MSELPKGWAASSLSEVSNVVRGITFPASAKENSHTEKNVCCLRTSNIQREVEWGDIYFVDRSFVKRGEQFVQPGDILMSMANSHKLVGKVAITKAVPYPTAFGAFLSAIRPSSAIDGQYLFHLLRTSRVQSELRQGSSQTTNIANISVGTLANIEVPLAPLPEQKRIADKLDSTLARVEACLNRLDRLPALLKRFRQSILAAATSGRLTEDWRATRSPDAAQRNPGATSPDSSANAPAYILPNSWEASDVQSIAQVGTGSTPLRSNSAFYADVGTPWITSAATGQELVTSAEQFVTQDAITAHRLKIYPVGALLVAMYGEGKTRGQVTELGIPVTINQACAAVVVDVSLALAVYVKFALQANYFEMRELAEGGNQPNLNLSKIKEFPLALPPLAEQHEIVRRVETLFAFADRLEARLNTARKQAEQLTPALLAKAFRGELVPQDPNDEPASELIKRLAANRTDAPKPKRGRKAAA